jgi:alcohol dehydrogenase YqhD (iron-dependent ADH family)
MLNFSFYSPARLIFGKDSENQIGDLLKPHASKVLLHYGGGSIKKSGLFDRVVASLKKSGLSYVELGGVKPNPRLALAHEGIDLCKKENVDFILAVGGGSVIDSAKAIAMGVYYDGDVWDMFEKGLSINKALPVATILTIPAAGSEVSGDTVISNEEKQLKYGYGSPHLRPLLSVMNPELFYTLPKEQIGYGVTDIVSHVFERYFTSAIHTDLTDRLCEAVLKTVIKYAPIVYADPQNYNAWCEVGFGGAVAHNGLLGMGREEDWACHMIEHELSALYDVAHGAGLAVVIPAWMKYVYKNNINMFVQFATNVMGVDGSFRDPEALILEGIERFSEFLRKMGLPTTLRELGIEDDSQFELMAKKATHIQFGEEQPLGSLEKLRWTDVLAIYRLAQ